MRKLISLRTLDVANEFSKDSLGGKGYNLWKMAQAGVNVPPAVIINTSVCREYMADPEKVAKWVRDEAVPAIMSDLKHDYYAGSYGVMPLVSVRSGAKFSMPGMMDTILNVGLDVDNYDFWRDKLGGKCVANCAERLDSMYSKVVGGVLPKYAENQLEGAIIAVFKSWNNDRAKTYRKMNNISDDLGTAVTVQAMVFGNLNDKSATGVMFTRDPATGANEIVGEWLANAQGEDVVDGSHTPLPMSKFSDWNADVAAELNEAAMKLEVMNRDMQDIEFTVQDGKLYILQTRDAKRTSQAAVAVAFDLWSAGVLSVEEAMARVSANDVMKAARLAIDPAWLKDNPAHATGLAGSPGVVFGKAVFSAKQAIIEAVDGPVILITKETDPDDLAGMAAATGILTGRGGMTSHAAVVARAMNKPAVVGCSALQFSDLGNAVGLPCDNSKSVKMLKAGGTVAIDGVSGNVWFGVEPKVVGGTNGVVKDFLSMVGDHYGYYEVATKARGIVNAKRVVYPAYVVGVAEFEAEAKEMAAVVDDLIIDLREVSAAPDSAPLAMIFGLPFSEVTDKVMALISLDLKCKVILPGHTLLSLRAKLSLAGYPVIPLVDTWEKVTEAKGMVIADHAALKKAMPKDETTFVDSAVVSLNCVSEVTAAMLNSKGKLAVAPMLAALSILS